MADLSLYEVEHRNFTTTMKLSAEDAEALGAKKVGAVEAAEPQPVQRPPWAVEVDETGAPVENDENADEVPEKRAAPARNKARHTK
ncbi:MAG TPA: hypothetical protein VIQ30_02480 [Pseudonocardia sp.]